MIKLLHSEIYIFPFPVQILTEVLAMFKNIDADMDQGQQNGVPVSIDIVRHFERAISSVINALLVGFRFGEDQDDQYNELNNQLWRFNNRMQVQQNTSN
jgi:hypothetical protein